LEGRVILLDRNSVSVWNIFEFLWTPMSSISLFLNFVWKYGLSFLSSGHQCTQCFHSLVGIKVLIVFSFFLFGSCFFDMASFISHIFAYPILSFFLKNIGERFMIWSFYFSECTWILILGVWNFSQHRSQSLTKLNTM
jgi:hypothetical protein